MGQSYGGHAAGMQSVYNPDLWNLVILQAGSAKLKYDKSNSHGERRLFDEEMEDGPNLIELAPEIDVPLSLLYGEFDPALRTNGRPLVEAVKSRGWTEGDQFRFKIFENEGHVIMDKTELYPTVLEHLEAYL